MTTNEQRLRHTLAVLTYTRPDLAQARIRELCDLYRGRSDVEVLIIDNGSTDPGTRLTLGSFSYSDDARAGLLRIGRIEPPNRGFGGGWNEGLKLAKGNIFYLVSDDVRVYGDIIGRIAPYLQNNPNSIVGHELLESTGWNTFGKLSIAYLMGHFLATPRAVWETLGGFDAETFNPYDYEDIDLSFRASKLGIGLAGMLGLPIEHTVAQTIGYSDERMEHTIKMRAAFAKKHDLPNVPEKP